MGANLMYTPLESVFEETMKREGRLLVTYSSGTEFRAFFRIRNDYENQRETIIIYYDVTAPVHSGTLVLIEKEVYLALNKETIENDVYYKSTLIKCNGVYNDNNGLLSNIPFYSNNMQASLAVGNNVITTINGNIEILTEENSVSKQIEINNFFNEFGRTFKITNRYSIDGIMHIVGEVYADITPTLIYSIRIDGIPDAYVNLDSELQLKATPYINGNTTTRATFDWITSDKLIASVDNTGKVSCLSEGVVKITVRWIEKDITETVNITVANEDTPPNLTYNYNIIGAENLKCSYTRTYTFSVTDGNGNIISDIDFQWNIVSDFEIVQNLHDNEIDLFVDDEDLIESTFVLQAIVDGEVKAEMEIMVTE